MVHIKKKNFNKKISFVRKSWWITHFTDSWTPNTEEHTQKGVWKFTWERSDVSGPSHDSMESRNLLKGLLRNAVLVQPLPAPSLFFLFHCV